MPTEAPTINSHRVLRAYRLNNVENVLLRHRLLAMNKEKRRVVRLNNQDIRLIQLTMDYIQSSSGRSPEGRPPDYVPPKVERDDTPYFLYGDRIKSRKFGKQRAQSAHVTFGRYTQSNDDNPSEHGSDTDSQTNNLPPKSRPKSSPAIRHRRHGEVKPVKFGGLRPAETGVVLPDSENTDQISPSHDKGVSSGFDLSLCSETIPELEDNDLESPTTESQPPPLARPESRPKSSVGVKKVKAFVTEESPSPDPQLSFQTPVDNKPETKEESAVTELPRPKSRKKSRSKQNSGDNELSARVAQERYKIKSVRKKPDPMQAWAAPAGSPKKMEEVQVLKGRINESRNKVIQDKLDAFKLQYPTKRY